MRYTTFEQFYPFYLSQHTNRTCRRLHVVGTTLMTLYGLNALFDGHLLALLWMPVIGYGFAWVGHYFYEHNRPATFQYPWFSLMGDFAMTRDVLTGKLRW